KGPSEVHYAYCESGDGGKTWSHPAPLISASNDLPTAVAYSVKDGLDLSRSEIRLSAASARATSLQVLVWVAEGSTDRRIFAISSVKPSDAASSNEAVGVLTWKPFKVGSTWQHVLTNRSLFHAEKDKTV